MKSYQQFFAELKRRHVFKVAAIYGATSFVVLQVAELMLPRLGLPDWTVTFMVALVLLAFPVAMILAWAFEVTPEGMKRTDAASPGELEGIVAQPASSRWPAGVLALIGMAALVASGLWIGRRTAPEASAGVESTAVSTAADTQPGIQLAFTDLADDPRPSIAVLPFADMSPEGDQEYFSDGMTEEILNVLAKVRDLRVSARTSAFAFKGLGLTAEQLGDTLRVRYLVEGSVRKAQDQLRITAQLIDARDGSHLWTDQYDRTLDDVFAIQTEIATSIAEALKIPLGLDDPAALVTPTADLEAYDLYLAGRERMRQRGSGVLAAIDLFRAAIARDSGWAPAWAGLAESQALVPYYSEPAADSALWARQLGEAEAAATTALSLDPDNGSATIALANVYRDRWDWERAEAAYFKALAIDPDNVETHQQYAEYLEYLGRQDKALEAATRALSLDRSPVRLNVAGYISRNNGLYEEAADLFREGIQKDPGRQMRYLAPHLFYTYAAAGQWDVARETALQLAWPDQAEEIRSLWPAAGPPPTDMDVDAFPGRERYKALFWQLLGNTDEVFADLESHHGWQPFGKTSVIWTKSFDPLRDDPRFEAFLESRGLAGLRPVRVARETVE